MWKSARMMSGSGSRRVRNSRSESTLCKSNVKPARRSSAAISSASAGRSSTTSTRRRFIALSERRRLVQQRPVESQLPDGFSELGEVNGLDDVAINAQTITFNDVPLLFGRGEHNHRHIPGLRIALNLPQHLQSVHFRELQIQQDHPRAFP